MKIHGKWYLEIFVEIKGTNSINEEISFSDTIRIPLNLESDHLSAFVSDRAEALWSLLTREMVNAYINDHAQDDDEMLVSNPTLVLVCGSNNLKREI